MSYALIQSLVAAKQRHGTIVESRKWKTQKAGMGKSEGRWNPEIPNSQNPKYGRLQQYLGLWWTKSPVQKCVFFSSKKALYARYPILIRCCSRYASLENNLHVTTGDKERKELYICAESWPEIIALCRFLSLHITCSLERYHRLHLSEVVLALSPSCLLKLLWLAIRI